MVTPEQDGETTEGEKISPENLEQHNNRLQFTPAFQMLSVYLGLEKHKFVFRILDVMESWKCRLYFSVYGIKKKKKRLDRRSGEWMPSASFVYPTYSGN